ncbi:hypothetical protein EBR16_04410, partial [bacterium]|nr:hypothetical protein [bacterium]
MTGVTVNNIIPGWIGIGGNDLASYLPGLGLAALNQTGYAGYDNAAATALPAASAAAAIQNIKFTGVTPTVPVGGLTLNSLVLGGGSNVLFGNSSDVLGFTAGTLMKPSGNNSFIGFFPGSGKLTSLLPATGGAAPFYVHGHGSLFTINSSIVDNGSTPVRLVLTTYNSGQVLLASSGNSYTGGTVINGWGPSANSTAFTLGAGAYLPAGGLTVSAADFVQRLGGVIDPRNVLTTNAAGTVTLVGTNTLAGMVLNDNGGWTFDTDLVMTVNLGTKLTLTGGITTTSNNVASAAYIKQGTLDMNGNSRFVFDVGAPTFNGQILEDNNRNLQVESVIANGGLVKTGSGSMLLLTANTYAGGTFLQQGSLILYNNAALGTGPLYITGNSTLTAWSATVAPTIANPIFVGPDVTSLRLGQYGTLSQTFSGAINLGNGSRTIDTRSVVPTSTGITANAQTLSGVVTGSGALTKAGLSTLVLSGNNSATLALMGNGAVTVNDGVLQVSTTSSAQASTMGGLGIAPVTTVADNLRLDGGVLAFQQAATIPATRGIQVGSPVAGNLTAGGIDIGGAALNTLTYAGVIANRGSAAGSLAKTGIGNLVLAGANTYTGRTLVSGGQLFLANAATLATGGSLEVSGATVDLLGNNQAGLTAVTLAGGNLLATGKTLATAGTLTGGAFTFGFSNVGSVNNVVTAKLAGTTLTKVSGGSGTLTLWNSGTFSGAVTLVDGSTYLNNAGAINGATALNFSPPTGSSVLFDNQSDSAITLTSSPTIGLNGPVGFGGTQALNLGTGAVALSAARTLTVYGSGPLTLGGTVSGSFALTKAGAGTLTLVAKTGLSATGTSVAGSLFFPGASTNFSVGQFVG